MSLKDAKDKLQWLIDHREELIDNGFDLVINIEENMEWLISAVETLRKDYKTHEKNYMGIVSRVLGRKLKSDYIHPTDAAIILEHQIEKLRKKVEEFENFKKKLHLKAKNDGWLNIGKMDDVEFTYKELKEMMKK